LNAHASATDMNVSSECFNIAQRILCVGDNIWILREKIIEIWDKIQRTLKVEIPRVKIIQMEGSKISSFTNIGNNVWMVGRHRNLGVAWIINPESYTLVKQLGNDPDQAKGSLHQAIQVGPLIWVVSWDKKILTWDAQTFEYCSNIPNCHRDAIECIVTRKSEIGEGWYVWTGSSDKTIDVMYVPENYAEKLKQLALEKHDTDPEICVSPVNITGIDPERRKKEKESPKANKLKKIGSSSPRNSKTKRTTSPRPLSPKLSPMDSSDGSHTPKSKNELPPVIKSQSLEFEKSKKSASPRTEKRPSGQRTLTPRNGSKCTSPETKPKSDLNLTLEPHLHDLSLKKRRKRSKIVSKKEDKKNGEAQDTEANDDDDEDEDHDEDVNKHNGSDEE